jgi:hypothetical protein
VDKFSILPESESIAMIYTRHVYQSCHFSNKNISQTGLWLRFAGYAPKGIMQMTADNWLFLLVISVWTLTAYLIATAPPTTAQEREEMEDDWWE